MSSVLGNYYWQYVKLEDETIIRNRVFLNNKDPQGDAIHEEIYYRKEAKGWRRLNEK